jgi:hypothetical protein
VACDVFQDELTMLAGDSQPWRAAEYLEMGLHDRPDELRLAVQAAVDRFDRLEDLEAIVLAYGLCGNGLVGIRAGRCPLVLPRDHDCISVLLGGAARHQAILKANPGTYFFSPGWIRGKRVPGPDREAHLRACYAERYSDDEELIGDLVEADQDTFAHYNCASYVDLTNDACARKYCQRCASWLGWSYRRLEGDPSILRDLLLGTWDEARYLIVPAGKAIGLTGNLDRFSVVD